MLGVLERQLIYFPAPLPREMPPPDLAHGTAEDAYLRTEDGVTVHGWYVTASRGPDGRRPVVLHFHGNAGNILDRADHLDALAARGLDVFILSYRGYGKSEGTPSEAGLYRDAEAAYAYLVGERAVEPGRVVPYGQSLGSAVAVELATRRPVGGLILESPFTSAPELGRTFYPLLPAFVFDRLEHRFDSLSKIGGVRAPLLVIHGERDEIVPLGMGRRLFEAAPGPKEWYGIPHAGHNDTFWVGGDAYYDRIAAFARRAVASAAPEG